jgi:hypothetical protein
MTKGLPPSGSVSPDAELLVQKKMLVGGTVLMPGQSLPSDSVLRQFPARLNSLCRTRYLRPVTAKPQVSKIDLKSLTTKALRSLARQHNVSGYKTMTRVQIRKSLKAILG